MPPVSDLVLQAHKLQRKWKKTANGTFTALLTSTGNDSSENETADDETENDRNTNESDTRQTRYSAYEPVRTIREKKSTTKKEPWIVAALRKAQSAHIRVQTPTLNKYGYDSIADLENVLVHYSAVNFVGWRRRDSKKAVHRNE
jgi:hypothetical protein